MMFQHFRVAKHTPSISRIIQFYSTRLGFDILGSFENHAGYNGVFLGDKKMNWHLEFTESQKSLNRMEDPDDLMVLYCENEQHYQMLYNDFLEHERHQAENPYWKENGFLVFDPDDNKILICKQTW